MLKVPELTRVAVAVVKKHGVRGFDNQMRTIIAQADRPDELRIAAADAIAPRLAISDDLLTFLTANSVKHPDPLARLMAARTIGNGRLTPAQSPPMWLNGFAI